MKLTDADFSSLQGADPEIAGLMDAEILRQNEELQMIASENACSKAVLEAMGSPLNNKYAEGYPGKRYYRGCGIVDQIETLAIDRAKALFGADHANVQPHSGSSANQAVYVATVQPGDTVLGLRLSHGGHLTHGLAVNFSGRNYRFVSYGVSEETGLIEYDEIERLADEHKPKMIVSGASAYPRKIDWERIGGIAARVGAVHFADMAHYAGPIAAGLYPSPLPHADVVGSTTHKTLRGPRSGFILCRRERAAAVDKAVFPGLQGGPLENIIAAKAVCFLEAASEDFRAYQRCVLSNARVLAEALISHGFRLVSGGTDSHLILVDLRALPVTGKDAAAALDGAGITSNANTVPGDTRSPAVTSGLRLGTPSLTTRGMGEEEMRTIAEWIAEIVKSPEDQALSRRVKSEVSKLCRKFPLYERVTA